ncbi:MAG: glycosyltransferase family 2 protein [Acidimicrobiia bacterium]
MTLDGRADRLPLVSVVMPVRNEEAYLARSLGAVLRQDYPADRLEVIVVDGASDDRTTAVAEALTAGLDVPPISVVTNPAAITPVSLNLGIEKAAGDIIVRVDGHCEIAPDYVRRCVDVLLETGVECVGGVFVTEGETESARTIAVAQSSRFGVGNVAFRTGRADPGLVDTVPFGAWPRRVFDEFGLFDEDLVRNQDDEFNFRVIQAGGRVWYDPTIRSRYFSRATLPKLWRQYFEYGCYKVLVAKKRGGVASARHLVPVGFVAALSCGAVASAVSGRARWLLAVVAPYAVANATMSLRLASRHHVPAPQLAAAFATLHLAYGSGFTWGAVRWHLHPKVDSQRACP